MTNEEQKAYHAKQEQERLNNCKIKTHEQFLDECKNCQNAGTKIGEANAIPIKVELIVFKIKSFLSSFLFFPTLLR